jgi:transcriptional regulator with PAS, ATPase and Fis domain
MREQRAEITERAYFEDTVVVSAETEVVAPMSSLRMLLLDSAKALRNLRDTASIREKLLNLIFSITPADRAAVLIDNSLSGRDRADSENRVPVNRRIVERVLKDGDGIIANHAPTSIICVPLEAFDNRMGVIYADSSDAHEPLNSLHLNLLTGVAAISAIALEHASYVEQLQEQNTRLQHDLDLRHDLVGTSPVMAELARVIAKVAPANSTVLIQGESGTGKELVARAVHHNSKRADGPFIAVNCAALAENLLESELFGYEKGAFTGAVAQKKGDFEIASGGTLFLDEVGELPPSIQAKLLRALQEREIKRLGGAKPIPVDIRLIAATNRQLEAAAARNEFRQDLYYRLKVVTITTPPLRDRPEDIPLLARHFVEKYRKETGRVVRGISRDAETMLMNYDWPGNVRELQNAIERAIVLGSTDIVLPEDLPAELFESGSADELLPDYQQVLNATKRDLIEKAFARTDGDYKKAAELLGLNATYIYRLLHNLKLTHLLK